MVLEFHASDLSLDSMPMSLLDRLTTEADHTIVGCFQSEHLPQVGDLIIVLVGTKGIEMSAKVSEKCFDFSTNTCQLWIDLQDTDALDFHYPHQLHNTIPYMVKTK
jgi:hypothetical protein